MEDFLVKINNVDEIADEEFLYRYFPLKAFPHGQTEIPSDYYSDPDLSCDWARLQSNPEQSFLVQTVGKRAIVRIKVCPQIRNPLGKSTCPHNQQIKYDPTKSNASHSVVNGTKKLPAKNALVQNSELYKIVEE